MAAEVSLKNARILVAEDNPINLKLVSILLEKLGCIVDSAANGEEAVNKARDGHYELILMDLQMPIMGGVEATKLIRQDISKDIPIIALTAAVMGGDKEKSNDQPPTVKHRGQFPFIKSNRKTTFALHIMKNT